MQSVGHHRDFHQVVVGRRAGRLKNKDISAAHVFIDFDHDFAVAEFVNGGITQRDVQVVYNFAGQFRVGIPGKDHHF